MESKLFCIFEKCLPRGPPRLSTPMYEPHNLCISHSNIILFGCTAASIWFEIWGSWIRVKKFNFYRQISEKLRFFRQFTTKNSTFSGKFPKIFDFFSQLKKCPIFQAKIRHLQLLPGKLFYFS